MKRYLLPTLFLFILLAACKKGDDPNNPVDPPAKADSGRVYIHLHTYLGNTEVDGYNIIYTLDNGRKISLSKAQLYVSGIRLVKEDGSEYPLPGVVLLKDLYTQTFYIATVPAGKYTSIRFKVGLDAATNAAAPTTAALNHPEMWFGSTAQPDGYLFLSAQGKLDTTAAATGTTAGMQPFVYNIGGNKHYQEVSMPAHVPSYTIQANGTEYIHLLADYSQLFNGLLLSHRSNLQITTKADNDTNPLSDAISGNNVPMMFRYEE